MKKILCLLGISAGLLSCGTVGRLSDRTKEAVILPEKDRVLCSYGKDLLVFQVASLWGVHPPYPVITGAAAGDYEAWAAFAEDKPEYRDLLPEESYRLWRKMTLSLLRKHSRNFDSLLFTVPGRLIAYTEEKTDIRRLRRHLDCAVMTGPHRYRYLDFGYRPSFMETSPDKYIFRSIEEDRSNNVYLAIDRIYLRGSDKVLCLMYPCIGKFDYVYDRDSVFHYDAATSWERFKPRKNLSQTFEFFYKYCDSVSIKAFRHLNRRSAL